MTLLLVHCSIRSDTSNGMLSGYVEKKGRSFSQIQHEESEEEDDEMFSELAIGGSKGGKKGQAKLNFSKKAPVKKAPAKTSAASKGKGKAKQIVLDSDDEDEDSGVGSSNTLKGDTMELDGDDDDDDGFGGASGRGSKASSSSSRRKPTPATSTAKRPTRKTAPQTIMIDDSESDSDSGLTFKVSSNLFSLSLARLRCCVRSVKDVRLGRLTTTRIFRIYRALERRVGRQRERRRIVYRFRKIAFLLFDRLLELVKS